VPRPAWPGSSHGRGTRDTDCGTRRSVPAVPPATPQRLFYAGPQLWVAEIGPAAAKAGRFGVVTEVQVQAFAVESGILKARVRTDGEQVFTDDRYRIDLQVAAPLEK